MNIRNISRVAGFVVATSLAAAGLATSAHADDTPPTPDIVQAAEQATEAATDTVSLMDDIVPTIADSTADEVTIAADGSTLTTEGDLTIVVSADPSEPVTVSTPDGEVSISAEIPAGAEATVVDGVTVFDAGHFTVAQQPVDESRGGGLRTLFTIESSDAPTTYDVTIETDDGGGLVPMDDGGVAIVGTDGVLRSGLDAPWAKDANGNALPTHYTINGNTVTQHVDITAATTFPVIADPWWAPTCNPQWFMVMNGAAPNIYKTAGATSYCIGQGWSNRAQKSWNRCWPNCPSWYALRFW